jgi:hypothetical protein
MEYVKDELELWEDKYKPVQNHINEDASWDGVMYETYGEEYDYVTKVASVQPHKVWTWVDGDNGTYIINGWHMVNRIGYFITQVPCEFDDQIEVRVDTYDDAGIYLV